MRCHPAADAAAFSLRRTWMTTPKRAPCHNTGRLHQCQHRHRTATVVCSVFGGRQWQGSLDVLIRLPRASGRTAVLPTALSKSASLSDAAGGPGSAAFTATATTPTTTTTTTTATVEEPRQLATAAAVAHSGSAPVGSTAGSSAAAGADVHAAAATNGGAHTAGSVITSVTAYAASSSLGELGSFSVEYDSDDAEMCALVADPSGDVQVVCESDPTHPLSLAEAAVLHPPLSPTFLQEVEAKLEADLITIAVTILFAVGFISLEFGVNSLIDHYFGDSVFADVVCVAVGLAVVFWVRLSKVRLMRFDRWR